MKVAKGGNTRNRTAASRASSCSQKAEGVHEVICCHSCIIVHPASDCVWRMMSGCPFLMISAFQCLWVLSFAQHIVVQVVVVLSESMEPGFYRGDILFLYHSSSPIRTGDIVVFNLPHKKRAPGEEAVPIVHRAVQVHERDSGGHINILTKGDSQLSSQDLVHTGPSSERLIPSHMKQSVSDAWHSWSCIKL